MGYTVKRMQRNIGLQKTFTVKIFTKCWLHMH